MAEFMTTDFHLALAWHENAKTSAPNAMSVKHTQAILDELNEALDLVKKLNAWGQHGTLSMGMFHQSDLLLARHEGAPYK